MTGLSEKEALKKLHLNGPNIIKQEAGRSSWIVLLEQFKSPLVIILIFASLIAFMLGEVKESLAIGTILVINALVGFFQEYRAETSIAALKNLTAPRATVLRDGIKKLIHADKIVEGDVLLLEAGDIVAADAKLLTTSRLQINEAILTGESVPALKKISEDKSGKVFMGTSVTNGTAEAVVIATGMSTQLGHIAHLISTAKVELTPLQKQLEELGKTLLYLCIVIVLLVALIGFFRGISGSDLLIFSISLAVAVVPEGLPAIVTVALALGVERLSRKKALIRKLPSVETLGSVSIICTDKTGTLTTGNMRVRELWTTEDDSYLLIKATSCCDAELFNESEEGTGDPTELAILIAAREKGISRKTIEEKNGRKSSEPFDSERKRMSIFRNDGINYVKGAVESILSICTLEENQKKEILKQTEKMTDKGLRVLAVATGKTAEEKNLLFSGLLGIADPPRPEAMEAISLAKIAGITPIMITGDHPHTAATIAKEMGLLEENENPEGKVHSRATPEEKLQLVRFWKEKGHVVAMTGDGVNDAPALREAHIGIAMGKQGTEVTRQAADIILTDDNFATIVAAVHEGRGIYQNIRKAVMYLLMGNLAELSLVVGAILLGLPIPLLASHLLWINIVTDALPALTLLMDPLTDELMQEKPRSPKEKMVGKKQWMQIFTVGFIEATCCLILYAYLLKSHSIESARNIVFTTLVTSQVLRTFGARSRTQVFWKLGAFSNLWLIVVSILTIFIQVTLHYIPLTQKMFELIPLTLENFELILPVALIPITLIEMKKILFSKH